MGRRAKGRAVRLTDAGVLQKREAFAALRKKAGKAGQQRRRRQRAAGKAV